MRVLVLGASYGALLGCKLNMAGHDATLVCLPEEAELINEKGYEVRIKLRGEDDHRALRSADQPGRLDATTPAEANPDDYDLVALAMQEPQYSAPEIRALAYRDWAMTRGRFDPAHFAIGRMTEQSGHDLALRLLDARPRPEVIVTANDTIAVGAYRAIQSRGLSIPGDVAVASFNDISTARFLTPPLTTVRLPAELIGETAVDLLAERLASREIAKQVVLQSRIVWRASTRRPPGAAGGAGDGTGDGAGRGAGG